MTTNEHVHQLVERLDADGLDIERLDEDQVSALEPELSSVLPRFGRRDAPDDGSEVEAEDHRDERPCDPLGNIIGVFDDPDGPTDVSTDKDTYVADAIQHR